jgi:hypothetical protein
VLRKPAGDLDQALARPNRRHVAHDGEARLHDREWLPVGEPDQVREPLICVHPTWHSSNLNLQVDGLPFAVDAAYWRAGQVVVRRPIHRTWSYSVITSTNLDRLQRFDPLEERTDGEVVGERLLVVTAGHPDLLAVGSVQPGVVPHNRPGRGRLASLGRADRWALMPAHRASLAGGRDLQPGRTRPSSDCGGRQSRRRGTATAPRSALGSPGAPTSSAGPPLGLPAAVERRREINDDTKAVAKAQIDRLCRRRDVPLRENALWRMLDESASRASAVLALNVENLDLPNKQAKITQTRRSSQTRS